MSPEGHKPGTRLGSPCTRENSPTRVVPIPSSPHADTYRVLETPERELASRRSSLSYPSPRPYPSQPSIYPVPRSVQESQGDDRPRAVEEPFDRTAEADDIPPQTASSAKATFQTNVFHRFEERFKLVQRRIEQKFLEAEADRQEIFEEGEEIRNGDESARNNFLDAQEDEFGKWFQAAMDRHREYFEVGQLIRSGEEKRHSLLSDVAEKRRLCAFSLLQSRDTEQYSAVDASETEFATLIRSRINRKLEIQQDFLKKLKWRQSALFKQAQACRVEQLRTLLSSSAPPFDPKDSPSRGASPSLTEIRPLSILGSLPSIGTPSLPSIGMPSLPSIGTPNESQLAHQDRTGHRFRSWTPSITVSLEPERPHFRKRPMNYIGLVRSLPTCEFSMCSIKSMLAGTTRPFGTSKSERSTTHSRHKTGSEISTAKFVQTLTKMAASVR